MIPFRRCWKILTVLGLLLACTPTPDDSSGPKGTEREATAAEVTAPFSVGADTSGLLFVWVNEEGSFQTTTELRTIPESAQAHVRVISEQYAAGTPDSIWLVRWTEKNPDGSFPVRSFPRKDWEELGLPARKARVEAQTQKLPDLPEGDAVTPLNVDAVVYGASWCNPCHQAEAYLKKKGARVVKKDIEEDPRAGAEMHRKLKAAGLGGASIPVLDVGGTLLVGFSTSAVDAALKRALASAPTP